MKTTFHIHRPLSASLPVILLTFATAASASCGSVVVETPSGAGGSGSATGNVGTGTATSAASSSTGAPIPLPLEGLESSKKCKGCHESIYNDWAPSMHARSLTGPVAIAQMNQSFELELKDLGSPDPQRLCVQCHSPVSSAFSGKQVTLPFKQAGDVPLDALTEGVGCATCHAYTGTPVIGAAGRSDFLNDFDVNGLTYYGPLANPVDSPAHQSSNASVLGSATERLCINCHNVLVDMSEDGKIVPGEDLVLQDTSAEHDLYLQKRDETCIDCHMPSKDKAPAADGPAAPPGLPSRALHSHGFVGADVPLDDLPNDAQLARRTELLQAAATLQVVDPTFVNGQVKFSVTIANVQAGHNLPTGFAFLRQMWVEVRVVDTSKGVELGSSGVLKKLSDDLCDADTLTDALQDQVQGCLVQNKNQIDAQLVNFQTKLVTDVDPAIVNGVPVAVQAPDATETWSIFVRGGAVARTRPVDQQRLAPLLPFEVRKFSYSFTLPPSSGKLTIEAALKFRSLPPYFLRTLAQKELELAQRLTQHLGELKPITMAAVVQGL